MKLVWLVRVISIAGYIFLGVGFCLLVYWAIVGARPVLECGIFDAIRDWQWVIVDTCLAKVDYDPWVGLLSMLGGGLLQLVARLSPTTSPEQQGLTDRQRLRNREALVRAVREMWIDGALAHSLYEAVLINLNIGKRLYPGPSFSFKLAMPTANDQYESLPPDTEIAAVFEDANCRLVILGAAGAGKSTMLLELTRQLLNSDGRTKDSPIPVVLNLTTWQEKRQAIELWLVEELEKLYEIPRLVAQNWVDNDELALMLDGLDEVALDKRDDCVEKLNDFCANRLPVSIAVCCREDDYRDLPEKLRIRSLVRVLPLTSDQIDDYLARIGNTDAQQLATILSEDALLRSLAEAPLMLNVMLLASGKLQRSSEAAGKTRDAKREVFDAFVCTMLDRDRKVLYSSPLEGSELSQSEERSRTPSGIKGYYEPELIVRWLSWLARKMLAQNATLFLIERMNKAWFNRRWQEKLWRVSFGLIIVSVYGLIAAVIYGPLFGVCFGLLFGILFTLVSFLKYGIRDVDLNERVRFKLNPKESVFGLAFGLAFWLVFGALGWLLLGVEFDADTWLIVAFLCELALGVVYGLVSKSSSLEVDYQSSRPNRATTMVLKSSSIAALGSAVVFGLVSGSVFGFILGQDGAISFGLFFGLVSGIGFGWYLGFADVIKHYTLRIILWSVGSMPLRYTRFLNYCTDRIFLRRAGGSYVFMHRSFQEYIADLDYRQLTNCRPD
ncbi:MAG: NACHT domain-containing protein [Caldilineaceae bacterium]